MREIVILGSTGSIGTQAIDLALRNPDRFTVTTRSAAGGRVEPLAEQAHRLRVRTVAVAQADKAGELCEAPAARYGGEPRDPGTPAQHLGFPIRRGRTAAIRHLVLQTPPPVIARMLGCNDDSTARLAEEAGGTWNHYAPGDRSR